MSDRTSNALWLGLVLLATGLMAWWPRDVEGIRYRHDGESMEWFSRDPDGLYHTRRIERVFQEGLPVAEHDPYLNYPEGADIPWPPYYDLVGWALLAPFAPEDVEERRVFLEQGVARLPFLFGVGSALLAALAVAHLARGRGAAAWGGALAAGALVAFCRSSINYSVIGTGDHHAWISFLDALLLLLLSVCCGRGALRSSRRGLLFGVLTGVLAGLMLGSWVASLLYVLNVQLVLGWLVLRRGREELPGVATLGLGFHLAAAAVVTPAVLSSPWREEFPWMVVNLSWFHLAQLLVGALVFVPLVFAGRGALAPGSKAGRRYPWFVLASLGVLALAIWLVGIGPAHGIAEGFAWVSRVDSFMDTVLESLPLVGPRSGGAGQLFIALGYGVVFAPIAWALLAWTAFKKGEDALLPWAIALPPLLIQALAQRRFGDALAVPLAVALGWALTRASFGPRWLHAPGVLALALLSQLPAIGWIQKQHEIERGRPAGAPTDTALGERKLVEWIRANTPPPTGGGDYSVLAHWDRGHVIEWVADRPSVATNFGSYIGVESYRDPPSFFMAEDPMQARTILERRRARYVLVPGSLPANLESMIRVVDPELRARYIVDRAGGSGTSPRWLSTMGARLLSDGIQVMPPGTPLAQRSNPLGFLRLVHVSSYREQVFRNPGTGEPLPVGFVWEHVSGAVIAARGAPGEEVLVELDISFPAADHRIAWRTWAVCTEQGLARLWVPYSTEATNGDAVVQNARWSIGGRRGTLEIPEAAVQGGEPLRIE